MIFLTCLSGAFEFVLLTKNYILSGAWNYELPNYCRSGHPSLGGFPELGNMPLLLINLPLAAHSSPSSGYLVAAVQIVNPDISRV